MVTFYLKIAKDNLCGLCNQLYALTGCIDHFIFLRKNAKECETITIIIHTFLLQIGNHDVCPISEIIDLTLFNLFLSPYNIVLMDGYNYEPTLFKQSPQLYFGGSQNQSVFVCILQHIPFKKNFYECALISYKNLSLHTTAIKINLIHLRCENDVIDSYSHSLGIDRELYIKKVENKYITLIKKYIEKKDLTFVLSSNYNNSVIDFLKNDKYLFKTTPKYYQHREANAIVDLLFSRFCNSTFIGVYESSFSYSLMYRIFRYGSEQQEKSIIFMLNDIEKIESVFHKHTPVFQIQQG
jgi:hypothetical protein